MAKTKTKTKTTTLTETSDQGAKGPKPSPRKARADKRESNQTTLTQCPAGNKTTDYLKHAAEQQNKRKQDQMVRQHETHALKLLTPRGGE